MDGQPLLHVLQVRFSGANADQSGSNAVRLAKANHCRAAPYRSYFAIFGNLFGFKNFGKLVAADNIFNSLFGLLQVRHLTLATALGILAWPLY